MSDSDTIENALNTLLGRRGTVNIDLQAQPHGMDLVVRLPLDLTQLRVLGETCARRVSLEERAEDGLPETLLELRRRDQGAGWRHESEPTEAQ